MAFDITKTVSSSCISVCEGVKYLRRCLSLNCWSNSNRKLRYGAQVEDCQNKWKKQGTVIIELVHCCISDSTFGTKSITSPLVENDELM